MTDIEKLKELEGRLRTYALAEDIFGQERHDLEVAADLLASLASKDEEIARLKAELAEESGWVSRHLLADAKTRAAIGEEFCLLPPDGGDVKAWEAAAALRARADSAEARIAAALAALEEARVYLATLAKFLNVHAPLPQQGGKGKQE